MQSVRKRAYETWKRVIRRVGVEMALIITLFVIGLIAVADLAVHLPSSVFSMTIAGLIIVGLASVYAIMVTRPDHQQALQSHRILEIANESLSYLRQGLTGDTAQAVCRYALANAEAAAVAITDRDTVLGFAGIGENHHAPGGPIITRATREALETNEHRVLSTKEEIGCPDQSCLLRAAIVVPLEMRGEPVGTLKFYYTTPRMLNETQVTMAEGLAKLLSTQLELSELERQTELATRMELKALQAQINPHFLFNTINTIAMFIRTDPMEARALLREFASFYRRTLEEGDDLITLERELEYTESYLHLEKARFGDRLLVDVDVPDELLRVPVPAFILQPVVENAVQHGVRPVGPLAITIRASAVDGEVRITVADDGVGIAAAVLPTVLEAGVGRGLGIALKNVDDRLKGYFGGDAGLKIESEEGVGTTVHLLVKTSTERGGT